MPVDVWGWGALGFQQVSAEPLTASLQVNVCCDAGLQKLLGFCTEKYLCVLSTVAVKVLELGVLGIMSLIFIFPIMKTP